MRWIKVAAVVIGALIVFSVIGAVVHLLMELVFAALVIGAIAVAIKVASGRRRVSRGRQDERVHEIETKVTVTRPVPEPRTHAKVNVDEDLARLKREMGG